MRITISIWFKELFVKAVNSIAFYPVIIIGLYILLSLVSISYDFSIEGEQLKSQLRWLKLKDASTARDIVTVVATGIISLTVFSFSMVMIVLNQAASNLSNRVLDKLITSRFQQIVLGAYVGTIVYSFILLSTIRNRDEALEIPSLSTYLLILLTILDIFLFIYFLHYITQSVRYEYIIQRIYKQTQKSLKRTCNMPHELSESMDGIDVITADEYGIYKGFRKDVLLNICNKNDCIISINPTRGTFVIKGMPIIKVNKVLSSTVKKEIMNAVYIYPHETIEENYFYGFRQLCEVAVKALSPGINDPGTAIASLRMLFQLLSYRACYFPINIIKDKEMQTRIITEELTYEKIFTLTVLPIWDYGKNDRLLQHEMYSLLTQLQTLTPNVMSEKLLKEVKVAIDNIKPETK
ncbi:MAG: DUF2254 domain-containing protein [Verrucomicrobia bacterium]|nr:DUF2254 domain-containing protein [Prolixibacteraceae bacterium]